jgi:hypothetical protein
MTYVLEIMEKFPNEIGKLYFLLVKLIDSETLDKLNNDGNKFESYKTNIFCNLAYKLFKFVSKNASKNIEIANLIKLTLIGLYESGFKFKRTLRLKNNESKGNLMIIHFFNYKYFKNFRCLL